MISPNVELRQLVDDLQEIKHLAEAVKRVNRDDVLTKTAKELHLRAALGHRHATGALRRLDANERKWQAALIRDALPAGEAVIDGFDPHGWFVYILWGNDPDRPLYVGQSTNVLSRLGSHLGQNERRATVRRVSLIRCDTRADMNEVEWDLIAGLRPSLNILGIEQADGQPA